MVEAHRIQERLDYEYMLRASAHGYDRKGKEISETRLERQRMNRRFDQLMLHDWRDWKQDPKQVEAAREMLKKSGGTSTGVKANHLKSVK